MRIIVFSGLTLWSMKNGHGGPAFTETLSKYINEGVEVFLISDELENEGYGKEENFHNLVVKPTVFKKPSYIKKIGKLFVRLDYFFVTRRFIKAAEDIIGEHTKDIILYAYEIWGVKACRILSRKYGIPFVSRFQGTVLSQYNDNFINRIKKYPHYESLSEKADLVIMTDDGTKGLEVLRRLGNDSRTLFLKNGLNLMERDIPSMIASFDRTLFRNQLGVSEDDIMFLTVSRLADWKKVDRAVEGFADFKRRNLNGKLVIVGDGDTRSALETLAREKGIASDVVFTGSVAHDMVYEYMMAADVFLSLYDLSNVGNPLLEAMALGKCIVTLDVGDTSTVIKNGENGVLLQMGELENLGQVMGELAEDSTKRISLGNNARGYAKDNFHSWTERMDIEFAEVRKLTNPDWEKDELCHGGTGKKQAHEQKNVERDIQM